MPAGLLGEAEALAEPPHPLEEAEALAEPPHPLPDRLGERVRRRRGGFLLILDFTLATTLPRSHQSSPTSLGPCR